MRRTVSFVVAAVLVCGVFASARQGIDRKKFEGVYRAGQELRSALDRMAGVSGSAYENLVTRFNAEYSMLGDVPKSSGAEEDLFKMYKDARQAIESAEAMDMLGAEEFKVRGTRAHDGGEWRGLATIKLEAAAKLFASSSALSEPGNPAVAKAIQTERIELVDVGGNVRARLNLVGDVPTLTLYDTAGTLRAKLTIPSVATEGLTFYDVNGAPAKPPAKPMTRPTK